ncbi:NrdJb [Wenzhouxiangella sp. AB-CW3]|uniref:TSCPD domain-containing protein n=1 Tax=Wenzhouxiangella sp. AB-CW3 TaxID=2771012 RepID=UPI00168A606C|nr:NrdJb [Wenzhouxiangella sp. AB-CW3]QOC24033.1 NrdJb [Wenzhouxiangella sp. AB-CW3]
MTIRIEKKIVNYKVREKEQAEKDTAAEEQPVAKKAEIIRMHEKLERPEGMECLEGATYKIRTPLDDHALYVTINDIVLNAGTEHEQRRPFEIFINSKNMDHFQWIVALTRVMSAVFRKGGDVTFLSEELQAVFDPKGGYFKPGGRFVPSIVADIGAVLEHHLKRIGLLEPDELSEQQQLILEQKRAEAEAREKQDGPAEKKTIGEVGRADAGQGSEASYPASATLCFKCNTRAMVLLDGCQTCLACGYSKCG